MKLASSGGGSMRCRLLRDEPRTFILALDPGDEVAETLTRFAGDEKIGAATLQAIGALSEVTFAYWNRDTREYEHIGLHEQVEVVSLLGNLARGEDGRPRLHAHIAIGRRDGRLLGGHLISGKVYPTLEIFVVVFEGNLPRRKDEETQLQLLSLS